MTRLATAGRSPPRRQPKNALHYVFDNIRCRKSARRVRRAGEETCERESACGPVAKAPDEPPDPYRLRASPRLYWDSSDRNEIGMDPDQRVREAVALVFRKFAEVGRQPTHRVPFPTRPAV